MLARATGRTCVHPAREFDGRVDCREPEDGAQGWQCLSIRRPATARRSECDRRPRPQAIGRLGNEVHDRRRDQPVRRGPGRTLRQASDGAILSTPRAGTHAAGVASRRGRSPVPGPHLALGPPVLPARRRVRMAAGAATPPQEKQSMKKVVRPTADDVAASAADEIMRRAEAAIEERGSFHWALSGGSTPGAIYRSLAANQGFRGLVPAIHLYWVDD